jgi:hypothetical protein
MYANRYVDQRMFLSSLRSFAQVRAFVLPDRTLLTRLGVWIVRVTAFTLRAVLAGKESAGENLNLLIATQVLYSVGFFGLIYSAYTLVLDR